MAYRRVESDDDIDVLVSMARDIWSDCFKDMFDSKTLPKLIESAQSKRAILAHIRDGYQYFIIDRDDERIGYFAYKIDRFRNELFLSKIYIYSDQRGKGVGKEVLNHLEELSHDRGIGKIALTVYHGNINSIKTYERWGFSNLGIIERQFDDHLVFEDFKMEKVL
ncbi:MAG: GNAT family N-acetyltransferase [Halobacteriota archaeon]|nr:GNAT family N-acetyltransferase [Halobacteriota archaeon]